MFFVHVRTTEKLNSMDNILLVAEARGENMTLGTIRRRGTRQTQKHKILYMYV